MKKNKSNINLIAIFAAVALFALAAFLYFFWSSDAPVKTSDTGQLPSLVDTGSPTSLEMGASSRCISDGSGFYLLLGDGIRRYDNSSKLRWDYPLNMSNPTYVSNATFVAIGEYKGSLLSVFGQSGLIYELNFDNEIINFTVGSNGYAAVTIASTRGGYTIDVYNATGKRITSFVVESTNYYPMHSALSPDGRVLAVSVLNLTGTQMESHIRAYYLRESDGMDFTDGMFANFHKTEGEIISKIAFIDDSQLMFLSDGQYGVYELSGSNRMILKWFREVNNEVSFANAINDKGMVIAFGKSLVNKDGLAEGILLVIDKSGKQIATHTMEGPVTYLHCGKDALIVGGGNSHREFAALSYKDKILWEYTATSDVLDFVILDKPEKVLLVSSGRVAFMETRKISAAESSSAPDNTAAAPASSDLTPSAAPETTDASTTDASTTDASTTDALTTDATTTDATPADATTTDATPADATPADVPTESSQPTTAP